MKTIKMNRINGALYATTKRSKEHLKSTGLFYSGGYLSLSVLQDHVIRYGFKIEVKNANQ